MRIAVLSAFPLVDRHRYRRAVIEGLAQRAAVVTDVALVYAFSDLVGALATARRMYTFRQSLAHVRPGSNDLERSPAGQGKDSRPLTRVARDLGIEVRRFSRYADPDCVRFLRGFRPDLVLNLGGMYVPPPVLAVPRVGVVGAHYARLPEIRGADTVRWTILLDEPMVVSHQILGLEYDMGDIVRRAQIGVCRGDTVDDVRVRCQTANAEGCLVLVERLAMESLHRLPQERSAGSYFRRMGALLRARVDACLGEARYSHYAPVNR